jgi:UDP-N-acetylglucosamine enolpyruvyl transferase
VLNLIDFLKTLGASIEVNYDHSIVINPKKIAISQKSFHVIGDMLEAGLYLAIGALSKGSDLTITGLDIKELLSTFNFARSV